MAKITPERYQNLQRQQRMLLDQAFDNIEWGSEPTPPASTPDDLELFATGYDCDGPSHGTGVLNDALAEAFFQKPGADPAELPKQIAIDDIAELSVPHGRYYLTLDNAMILLNGVHHATSGFLDLTLMETKCNGWMHDDSSSWSLMREGVTEFTSKFGKGNHGQLLRDAEWARTNGTPRFDQLQFEQQGSKAWGSDYDGFFEYAKWNDSDVWLTVTHKAAKPVSTFFLDALARKGKAFYGGTGHRVSVEYSNDLLGDHGQCDWIRDYSGKFYPDLDAELAYARMVGFFAAGVHFQMAKTWDGFQFVLPLGFDGIMLEEYRKAMPDNEVFWCKRGEAERSWELWK